MVKSLANSLSQPSFLHIMLPRRDFLVLKDVFFCPHNHFEAFTESQFIATLNLMELRSFYMLEET